MLNRIVFAGLAGAMLVPLGALAQDLTPEPPTADQLSAASIASDQPLVDNSVVGTEAAAADAPPPPFITIPRLTPLVIELLATLSSETSATGERFPIRLFEPVVINGETVVPAGTLGEGEVIHAKRKGGMGAAGELIITARFLDLQGRHLPLRSLRVNGDGQSRIDTVNSIAVASAATIPLASLVGFFITGGAKTVNEGTVASARTAEDFDLLVAADPAAASAAEPEASPETTAPVEQTEQDGSNMEDTRE